MHYYLRRLKIDCMIFLRKIKHHLKKYTKVINNHDFVKPLLVFQRENEAVLLLEKKSLKDEAGITVSKDGFNFSPVEETMSLPKNIPHFPKSVILPNFYYHGQKVMFFGDRSLKIAYLTKDNKWRAKANPLLTLPHPIELGNVFIRKEGLLVFYHEKKVEDKITYYASHFAFFEKKNPSKFLFKTEEPVLEHKALWSGEKAEPLGSVFLNEQIITYWHLSGKIIWAVILAGIIFDPLKIQKVKLKLKKHSRNPIITPRPENNWEAFNTFNPAALYAGGKVHILYRAQGFDYISTVGYASSRDGINIDERLSKPVFSASLDGINTQGFISNEFFSGGGLGGCEDPRLTQMGDKVYMTYVAFNYNMHPRLALTSILLEDFLNKRWHWSKPVLISPPGVIDKSGCLLPEKINNKYVFFHRVFPNILVDFVDDLNFDGKTCFLKGKYQIKVRKNKWDSRKIGTGAPPLKTKDGWLLIYYGVDNLDASKYHIGAMLLDLKNPTRVLYRTDKPILGPTEDYENCGFKPGIAYPCGAVILNNQLLVYYGGADSVVCVASANLSDFLADLKAKRAVKLEVVKVKEVVY